VYIGMGEGLSAADGWTPQSIGDAIKKLAR
jgi:hypothetical protein